MVPVLPSISYTFIAKYLLNFLPAWRLHFLIVNCVFFYDREWWKQILSTTVRSLWQEPLILLEAQCVQCNDCAILCFDTFCGCPTLTQALGLPGTLTVTVTAVQLEASQMCYTTVRWEAAGRYWLKFKYETTHFVKLRSIFF